MSDTLISVRNVSKAYRIWESPSTRLTSLLLEIVAGILPGSLGDALRRQAARHCRDFWALKDVSFELRKGESVGIINGSAPPSTIVFIFQITGSISGKNESASNSLSM